MSHRHQLYLLALLITVGCSGPQETVEPPPIDTPPVDEAPKTVAKPDKPATPADVVRDFTRLFNKNQRLEATELFADNVVWTAHGEGSYNGRAEISAYLFDTLKGRSSNLTISPTWILQRDNLAVWQAMSRGTHDGSAGNLPATQNPCGTYHLHIFRFEGGLVASVESYTNLDVIEAQMGHERFTKAHAPWPPESEGDLIVVTGEASPANENVVKQWYQTLASSEWKAYEALMTDDMLLDDYGAGGCIEKGCRPRLRLQGGPAYVQLLKETRRKDPFVLEGVEQQQVWSAGEWVVSVNRATHKHVRKLGKHRPTRKSFTLHEVGIFRVTAGKVAEADLYHNPVEALEQLGLRE